VGDTGELAMEPGLLTFLATPHGSWNGERPGKHVHPMSGIPLGLAIHAAIMATGGRENGVDVLRGAEISMESPISFDEAVARGGAGGGAFPPQHPCSARVYVEKTKKVILKGTITLVRTKDGRAEDISELHGENSCSRTAPGPDALSLIVPGTCYPERRKSTMAAVPSTMLPLGTPAPNFALKDVNGELVSLKDFADAPALVVIFMCNHCPYVKHLQEALVAFARDYMKRGAAIVAVNSNDTETHPEDSPAA
jgi:hypothetical protein